KTQAGSRRGSLAAGLTLQPVLNLQGASLRLFEGERRRRPIAVRYLAVRVVNPLRHLRCVGFDVRLLEELDRKELPVPAEILSADQLSSEGRFIQEANPERRRSRHRLPYDDKTRYEVLPGGSVGVGHRDDVRADPGMAHVNRDRLRVGGTFVARPAFGAAS